MAVHSLYVLPAGIITIDRSILISGIDIGTKVKSPVYAVLLMHDDGPILVDTGLNPDGLIEPEKACGPESETDQARNDRRGYHRESIKGIEYHDPGYPDGDLDAHALGPYGQSSIFQPLSYRRAKVGISLRVSARRLRFRSIYEQPLRFPPPVRLIEGDRMVAPGVSVFRTSGHTPGHQSVIVKLASGKYCYHRRGRLIHLRKHAPEDAGQ